MEGGEGVSAEDVAAQIAPIVDRLRLGIASAAARLAADLVDRYEVGPPTIQVLAMLRNAMPARAVAREDLAAVFVYEPDRLAQLDVAVASSLLEPVDEGSVRLAPRGQALIADLQRVTDAYVAELWSEQAGVVADIGGIVAGLAERAAADPGPALRVLAPVYEPEGASPAMLLAERLTVLRFHRFDAHVEAWQAEGLTASQMRSGPSEQLARRIEDDTNRRAAVLYAPLSTAERRTVLVGLGALAAS